MLTCWPIFAPAWDQGPLVLEACSPDGAFAGHEQSALARQASFTYRETRIVEKYEHGVEPWQILSKVPWEFLWKSTALTNYAYSSVGGIPKVVPPSLP